MLRDSNYRQVFADLLRDTVIPAFDNDASKRRSYQRLNGYIKGNMPKSLFRYRSTASYNIEALRRGNIPVTKPSEMGDIFDSQIVVDIERVVTELMEMLNNIDVAANHIFEGKPFPDFAMKGVSRKMRRVVQKNKGYATGNLALKPQMRLQAASTIAELKKRAESEYGATTDVLRHTGYIACFCEDVNGVTMWDRYADRHRGYALEYEFERLNARFHFLEVSDKSIQPDYVVLPVIYGETYNSSLIIIHSLFNQYVQEIGGKGAYINHPDELWSIKGYLYKAADYKSEAEWRLITPLKGVPRNSKSFVNVDAVPIAIYYGANMPDNMRHELETIAVANGLTRYRMEINPLDMGVKAVLL